MYRNKTLQNYVVYEVISGDYHTLHAGRREDFEEAKKDGDAILIYDLCSLIEEIDGGRIIRLDEKWGNKNA